MSSKWILSLFCEYFYMEDLGCRRNEYVVGHRGSSRYAMASTATKTMHAYEQKSADKKKRHDISFLYALDRIEFFIF